MKELQELVRFIELKGRLTGSHLIQFSDEENLETKFYKYLKENKEPDESLLIKHLYGSDGKKSAFKMLKSRFRRKLFNQLGYLNLSDSNGKDKLLETEIRCSKFLAETNILISTDNKYSAEKQVLDTLKLAQEAKLTRYVIEALEQYLSIISYNHERERAYKIKSELEKQYQILNDEREANLIYRISLVEGRTTVKYRELYLNELEQNVEKLKILWEKTSNSYIFYRYHFLKMLFLEFTGNYSLQIPFIKETQRSFERGLIHPYYYNKEYNSYILVYASLRTGLFEEGLEEAARLKEILRTGYSNWFANNQNYFLLAIHSKKYEMAGDIVEEVFKNNSFKKLRPVEKERWMLFSEFLKLLTGNTAVSNIHVNLKEVQHDKKGFNIWLLILDFLMSLRKGKYDELDREAERIRKYMSKYLQTKADPRNRYFLKLLMLVVREEFDLAKIKSNSRYLYNKLVQTPPAGDAYAEVEIVPFEHLWDYVLSNLPAQKVEYVKP